MRRTIPGLAKAAQVQEELPAGEYLVEVTRAQHRWQKRKPYYAILFRVLQPTQAAGSEIHARLYCTPKALWKLSWFLKDFGYDTDLLERDELDEESLTRLRGVVQLSYSNTRNGARLLDLEAFAPADRWRERNNLMTTSNADGGVA